jgi:hypothetical protein
VTFGFSWRGAVVEIVRVVVDVRVRTESGVEACRGLRKARVALLRLMGDSVARIVYIFSCCRSES